MNLFKNKNKKIEIKCDNPLYSGEGITSLWFNYSSWIQLPLELNNALGREFTFECWFQVGPVADTRYNPNPGNWGSSYTIALPVGYQTTFDLTGLINFTSYYNLSGYGSNFTIGTIVSYSALNRPIVSRWRSDVRFPDNAFNDFDLQINPEGLLQFFMGGGFEDRNLGVFVEATNPLESNRWYHVAVSVLYSPEAPDALPQSALLTLDYDWDTTHVTDFNFANWRTLGGEPPEIAAERNYLINETIYIGRYQNNDVFWPNGQYFVGMLDELRFWNGVRLPSEINLYMNRSIGGYEPWLNPPGLPAKPGYYPAEPDSLGARLVAAYNLNEGSGNIAHDQGPYHFDGNITNPMWRDSQVYIIQYYYLLHPNLVNGQLPLVNIPLYATGGDPNPNYHFTIIYNETDLQGNLIFNLVQFVPSGTVFTAGASGLQLEYQFTGNSSGVYGFYYLVQDPNQTAWVGMPIRATPVRIVVDLCTDGGDHIDACGVCNGNATGDCFGICNGTATLDACGVCNGTNSTCIGCDGVLHSGKVYDACGVCGGNNSTCAGCDGIPHSNKTVDYCGVCGGNNATLDACGVCNGTNSTCCDFTFGSTKQYDVCGICGGNGTSCLGCDGVPFSNKTYDACGVCGGNNSTCGGCDGHGGVYDACGICAGNNSTCMCVDYDGFSSFEMDYLLYSYTVDQIAFKVDYVQDLLLLTLEDLQYYNGPGDFGVMIRYFNSFCQECLADYEQFLDNFIQYLQNRKTTLPNGVFVPQINLST